MGLNDARAYNTVWDEAKHHRGQPDNAGQFGPGGGAADTAADPGAPADEAGDPRTFSVAEDVQHLMDINLRDPYAWSESDEIDRAAIDLAVDKGDELRRGRLKPGDDFREQMAEANALIAYRDKAYAGMNAYLRGQPTVTIDADAIKTMLPEFPALREAGDANAAGWVHEESSDLSKDVMRAGFGGGHSVVLDGTGDSSIESLSKKLLAAKAKGLRVVGEYATVSVDEAIRRARQRAETHKDRGMVPESVIRHTHASVSLVLPQAIGRGLFDEARVWDTETNGPGKPPKMIAEFREGKLTIHDDEAWKRFQAKGEVDTGKG